VGQQLLCVDDVSTFVELQTLRKMKRQSETFTVKKNERKKILQKENETAR